MTSFEGDTGPYLQYAHARLCSIVRKSGLNVDELDTANLSLLTETHATDLARLLAQWPDVLLNTNRTLEPTTILTYLFRMTHVLSSSYDVLKVVGSEPELKKARMALYESARQVLHNGMRILGLSPVNRYVKPHIRFIIHSTNESLVCNGSDHKRYTFSVTKYQASFSAFTSHSKHYQSHRSIRKKISIFKPECYSAP